MKKTLIVSVLAFAVFSCNQTQATKEVKTAYVDTSKLLKEYKAKYPGCEKSEAKYKAKSEEMGRELEAEVNRFKSDAANFQKNAQANGQVWAQQKGAELQKREQQLSYAQQAILEQLQQESGTEMDSLVSNVKKFIKDYGKEKGYDYIYGTGEAVSILYAQEKYDITNEIVKSLNDKYKSGPKTDTNKTAAPAKK